MQVHVHWISRLSPASPVAKAPKCSEESAAPVPVTRSVGCEADGVCILLQELRVMLLRIVGRLGVNTQSSVVQQVLMR